MFFKKASDKVEALKGSFREQPMKDQDIANFVKARFKFEMINKNLHNPNVKLLGIVDSV